MEHLYKKISRQLNEYYSNRKDTYGVTPMGAGWKSREAQDNRFAQLSKVIERKSNFSVNDLGCGFGDFSKYLSNNGFSDFSYAGYDISEEMIDSAKKIFEKNNSCSFLKISNSDEMRVADYSVASGIMNIKYTISEHEWIYYMLDTIHVMNRVSNIGFAFNALTKYSDKEFMKEELYYADPCFFFDYCKRNFSKKVALLHDYEEYDFTIIVRK